MCILYFYYCEECNELFSIPPLRQDPTGCWKCVVECYQPRISPNDLPIFDAVLCQKLSCKRYSYYYNSIKPVIDHLKFDPVAGAVIEGPCGMIDCDRDSCHTARIYRICDDCNGSLRAQF